MVATIGTRPGDAKETAVSDKCLDKGTLDSEKDGLSVNDTTRKATRPTGFEPATTGSTIRYSNQLSYGPNFGEQDYTAR